MLHPGGRVLLLSTAKHNRYLGLGTIPQKGSFVELTVMLTWVYFCRQYMMGEPTI
jgi:hypothetical protein